VTPREEAQLAGEAAAGTLDGAGASARGSLAATGLAAPPLHLAAHGGLPPVRDPGHRPPQAGRRYAAERARMGMAIRASSLEPAKITVQSAPACGLRVTA
jgi:hypothetical protein